MSTPTETLRPYAQGHVRRALAREEVCEARRLAMRREASAAARELFVRYGDGLTVYVFGSVLDPRAFRLDSDVDLAVRGLSAEQYYEAWRLAESKMTEGQIDLIRLEAAPDWLVDEVETRGERIS